MTNNNNGKDVSIEDIDFSFSDDDLFRAHVVIGNPLTPKSLKCYQGCGLKKEEAIESLVKCIIRDLKKLIES